MEKKSLELDYQRVKWTWRRGLLDGEMGKISPVMVENDIECSGQVEL